MPTVIDQLVVEIGLDPTKYKAGMREALAEAAKGKEKIVSGSNEVERHTKGVTESFSKFRNQLLGVAALFTGGLGMAAFVRSTVDANSQVGRLSTIIETSTGTISKFRTAGAMIGGGPDSLTNVLKTITLEMAQLQLTGESKLIPWFRALGIDVTNGAGKFKNATELFLDLTDAIASKKIDPARGALILQAMGADDAAIAAMLKGRKAMEAYLDAAGKVGAVTKEDVAAASALNMEWAKLVASSGALGNAILTRLTPKLAQTMSKITEFFQTLRQRGIRGSFDERFGSTSDLISRGTGERAMAGPDSGGLRVKPDSGSQSPAVAALARSLQDEVPGLNRFTAFDDDHHKGTNSAHARGRALDFTLKDPSTSSAVAAQIRKRLAAMGVDGKVIDEYANPSPGSTGGHIHVQVSDAGATQLGGGAGTAAALNRAGGPGSSTSKSEVHIDKLIVNSKADDAAGIAKDVAAEIKGTSFATHANGGQQ